MIKKFLVFVAGTALTCWALVAVILPGRDVVLYRNGRFPSGAEEFYMADGFRDGTLVVRDYWHREFKDGFVREYGSIAYGLGSKRTDITIEVTHDKGAKPKVVNAIMHDGHFSPTGSLWRQLDDPTIKAEVLREGQKSIEMGRQRLAAWKASQSRKE